MNSEGGGSLGKVQIPRDIKKRKKELGFVKVLQHTGGKLKRTAGVIEEKGNFRLKTHQHNEDRDNCRREIEGGVESFVALCTLNMLGIGKYKGKGRHS